MTTNDEVMRQFEGEFLNALKYIGEVEALGVVERFMAEHPTRVLEFLRASARIEDALADDDR